MTLEPKNIIKEGWLTVYKSRKPTFFSSKPVPDKLLDRGWAVLHQFSSKGPVISFYQDNRKESKVMKREKIELMSVRQITRMLQHPKQPHCFTLRFKGTKRILLNTDTEPEREAWLKALGTALSLEYSTESVIWEHLDDGGLWQALPDDESYKVEAHFCEGSHQFHLGDYHYSLHHMTRNHPRTKHSQRIKRTQFVEERRDVLCATMKDLPAIWEWGDSIKSNWHPFERDTNIQIEDMYDSGSQWAELTLCLPSPMPFLLDLHDMKLVNFRTAVRYNLRRIDQSDSMEVVNQQIPQARSPSPDDMDDPPFQEMAISPTSPLFQPLQETLQQLQMSRKSITYKHLLGEGAFGEVYLADATGVPGYGDQTTEVAVKQLRLSDFIARHGHHSQQMEDFLREAKEMAKVDYPRVVKLMAVCTLDYPLLLVEEYMNLGDLLGVLKDSRPSMPLVTQMTFAFHVADGMHYLADVLNCVHRDLAARNILVHQNQDKTMDAKIADFGLSRHLYSDLYKQGNKPRPLPAKWMALESLMYFTFSTKSDVWSYGVLLWEIMTLGRNPYPGVENRELLEQLEEKGLKLSKPKPCPPEIYEMILDCTQHAENDRPTFKDLKDKTGQYLHLVKEGKMGYQDGEVPPSPSVSESSAADRRTDSGGQTAPNGETGSGAQTDPGKDTAQGALAPPSPAHLQRPPSPITPPPPSKAPPPPPPNPVPPPTKPKPSASRPETTPTKSPLAASPISTHAQHAPNTGNRLSGATNNVNWAPDNPVTSEDRVEMTTGGHLYYLLDPLEPELDGTAPGLERPRTDSGLMANRPISGSIDSDPGSVANAQKAAKKKKGKGKR